MLIEQGEAESEDAVDASAEGEQHDDVLPKDALSMAFLALDGDALAALVVLAPLDDFLWGIKGVVELSDVGGVDVECSTATAVSFYGHASSESFSLFVDEAGYAPCHQNEEKEGEVEEESAEELFLEFRPAEGVGLGIAWFFVKEFAVAQLPPIDVGFIVVVLSALKLGQGLSQAIAESLGAPLLGLHG